MHSDRQPNPYAPPSSSLPDAVASTEDAAMMIDATGGQRFGGYLIDTLCFLVFSVVVGVLAGVTQAATGLELVALFEGPGSRFINYLIYVCFYVMCEGATGTTLGKKFVGTRLVTVDGGRPSFGKIVGRSFARIIPFEPLSYFGSKGMWHDTMSGTRVVQRG